MGYTTALVFVLVTAFLQYAAAQCKEGDAACYCNLIKGSRIATPTSVRPLCRKTIDFQGRKRIVDIYFPIDIGASGASFTPWIHLHGVQLGQWWLDAHKGWSAAVPLGGNADASRMNVLIGSPISSADSKPGPSDGLVKQPGAILIVPQGTGDVDKGQMWNSIFWPCMFGPRCVDNSVDDVTFLSDLIKGLQQLLPGIPIKQQAFISGYSNGGMILQTMLCKRPDMANHLAGVAIISSMLGSSFASSECQQKLPRSLPMVWMHGVNDPVLPYGPGSSMDVQALGAEGAMRLWADKLGCPSARSANKAAAQQTFFSDASAGVSCTNLCSGQQQPPVVVCSVSGAGHGMWDQPSTGYSAGVMHWAFGGFQGKPRPF